MSRFYLKDAQAYDLKYDTSWVRLFEMILDHGTKAGQTIVMQFFRDWATYGLDEALIYAEGYAERGYYKSGTVPELRAELAKWHKEMTRNQRTSQRRIAEDITIQVDAEPEQELEEEIDIAERQSEQDFEKGHSFKRLTRWPAVNGSFRVGQVEATYGKLVEVFGEPEPSVDWRTNAEWVLQFDDGEVASIYDYRKYHSELKDIQEWNIGGTSPNVVERIHQLLGTREQDELQDFED